MKSYLLILLVLLIPSLCLGGHIIQKFTSAASVECDDGCDGVSDADLFCEDMDGTGSACTWTDVGTVSWDSTNGLSALTCATKGDGLLEITITASQDNYTYHSDTASADVNDVFYLRISSTDVDTHGEYQMLSQFSSGADVICGLYIAYDTDHLELQYSIDGSRQSCPTAISLNTWYKIERQYDGGVAVRLWLNDVLEKEDTVITESDSVVNYLFGAASGSANHATTFQIAINKADDDTMPGTCGE